MVFEVLRGSLPVIVSANELFMFLCILNRRATAAERLLRGLLMDLFFSPGDSPLHVNLIIGICLASRNN